MNWTEAQGHLTNWLLDASVLRRERPWCLFGLTGPITQAAAAKLFDRTEVEEKFKKAYAETDPALKKPHLFFQVESHAVYGLHKSFVARHKTRLQLYRDDASQKAYHVRRTTDKSSARLTALQQVAEARALDS